MASMLAPEVIARAKGLSFVIPFGFLREILSALLSRPYHLAQGEVGVRVSRDTVELLCRSFAIVHEGDAYAMRSQRTQNLTYSLAFSPVPISRPQVWRLLALSAWSDPPERPALQVLLGSGQETGLATGLLRIGSHTLPLEAIRIIGPGFARIGTVDFPRDRDPPLAREERERWSRLIGALGEQAWRTLITLKCCIVGVGRLGSLIALSLAKAGAGWIALLDPDHVELHNLDAMDGVRASDLGRLKVEAIRDHLSRGFPGSTIFSLPHSLITPESLAAVRKADVIINCPDTDAPRLLAGILACLHLKVLLDIGTGVFDERSHQQATTRNPLLRQSSRQESTIRNQQIGADIRLLLPGEACLLCAGGVADEARALSQLLGEGQVQRPWHEERAGSLRSLNHVAAHLGLSLLENLVAGRLVRSTWLRLEIDHHGLPSLLTLPLPVRNPRCLLCAATSGGDSLAEEAGGGI